MPENDAVDLIGIKVTNRGTECTRNMERSAEDGVRFM